MKNLSFILGSALLLICSWGCKKKHHSDNPVDNLESNLRHSPEHERDLCFQAGGSEFHLDTSGAGNHFCVFKRN